LIESYAEIPDIYESFFHPLLAQGRDFPYTVLIPSYEGFIHRQTEKLISDFGCEIYILEKKGNTFEMLCYLVEEINYVEFRTALLASSLQICGRTSAGVLASSTLAFNSITNYLLHPILTAMRHGTPGKNTTDASSESQPFNHLSQVNYKFMNYARQSLLAGESLIHSMLQPEIGERMFKVLGKEWFRLVSAAHMVILTDRELILIREGILRRKENKYGGTWDYIPLSKVRSLSINEKAGNLLELVVQLPEGIRFELPFAASARDEIKQVLDKFKKLTGMWQVEL